MYAYAVIPEKLVKAQGAKDFFQHPIGSGEWMLTQWNKGSDLTFKVNPHWSGPKPNFTTLKIMIVPNDNSRVLLLQNKNADIIENPPGNLINELSAESGSADVSLPVDSRRLHPARPALRAVQGSEGA